MKLKTIKAKIIFWAGAALLITTGIILSYSTIVAHNAAINAAQDNAVSIAESYARHIEGEMGMALNTARTLAQTLSAIKDPDVQLDAGRDEVKGILQMILNKNPAFVGVFTCWAPDAFDGMDKGYAGQEGHDRTGRLIPYWTRNKEGKIALEPLIDYEKPGIGDFYLKPKETMTEWVIDPYIYPVQGKDTLITSLVVPIVVKNQFYGVVGVNLKLDFLQALADKVDIYDGTGKLALITHNGTLAGVTGSPDLVGKPATFLHKDFESGGETKRIQKGEKIVEFQEDELEIFFPVRFGSATTPWSLNILIPKDKITEEARAKAWYQVGISLLCVLVGLIGLWFMAGSIAKLLKVVIEGLTGSAYQVSSASGQVSSASQQLAEGSSEQAASIEETSSSLEEMASMTKQNADNATQADNLMKEANQVVDQANKSMNELTGSMEEISKASEETSKIIKTIDEIAFQTNLLALNAAVEAARAGEAGAGFAVVADEVRNLAMRAADAARNTADLIEGTVKKTKDGTELVTKTNEAFSEVATSAAKVGELVAEIAAASNEQAQGIEQVNKAVTEMDKVVQQNAANAEESASASEEMNAQAEQMKGFVDDLVALVGGSAEKATEATIVKAKPQAAAAYRAIPAHAEMETTPQARKLKPEQLIPMENDDF